MALLPYASRVTQTRGPKRDGERGGRRERDLPAPETEPMSPADDVRRRRARRRARRRRDEVGEPSSVVERDDVGGAEDEA